MESFDGVLSHQNIIRQARTMISIKSRVLIKTVQLYSISNMTIKITGGPKWIVCTVPVVGRKAQYYTFKGHQVSPLETDMSRMYLEKNDLN